MGDRDVQEVVSLGQDIPQARGRAASVLAMVQMDIGTMTEQRLERKVLGPLGDTAAELARGFDCGNCDGTFGTHNCIENGCCSLHDGIYEELKHIDDQLNASVREREDWNGKHQVACLELEKIRKLLRAMMEAPYKQ